MLGYRKDPLIRLARERHARVHRRTSIDVAVRVSYEGQLYECPLLPLFETAELTTIVGGRIAPFVVTSELDESMYFLSALPLDRGGPPLYVWRTKRPRGNSWRSLDLHTRSVADASHCRIRLIDAPHMEPD